VHLPLADDYYILQEKSFRTFPLARNRVVEYENGVFKLQLHTRIYRNIGYKHKYRN